MIDLLYPAVLVSAGLIMAAIFTSVVAFRFGAPLLLIFLAVGLIAGENGLGLRYNDPSSAYVIGSIALAVILFDSGFGTRIAAFRQASFPAIGLATVGVVLTAGLLGVAARFLFGFSWPEAFLLGAIVSSTDAAAVFFLLRVGGIDIRERVRSTLEVESGSNDPMAIFLTITFVEVIASGAPLAELTGQFITGFILQMGGGLILGLLGGMAIVRLVNRLRLETGLYPVVVLAASLVLFGFTGLVGGSGFLAVYVAGLYAGNRKLRAATTLKRFQDGMTWLAQIIMFLMFGLLATPAEFPVILLPSLLAGVFLIVVARPIAVWLCLLPFRPPQAETAFIAWVGLRGAVSLLLALLPRMENLPNGQAIFNSVFVIVITSLIVQGWTIKPLARRLALIIPPRIGPVEKVELELPGAAHHELVVYHIVPDSPVALGERIPRWAMPSLVVRDGQSMRYQFAGRIQAGDYLYLFTPPRNVRLLDRLFASRTKLDENDKDFFGEFQINAKQTIAGLAQAYGLALSGDPQTPIGQFMTERLGGDAEIGDRVPIQFVELIVREIDDKGAITSAGLVLEPEQVVVSAIPREILQAARSVIARLRRLAMPSGQDRSRLSGTDRERRAPVFGNAVRRLLPKAWVAHELEDRGPGGEGEQEPVDRQERNEPSEAEGAAQAQSAKGGDGRTEKDAEQIAGIDGNEGPSGSRLG